MVKTKISFDIAKDIFKNYNFASLVSIEEAENGSVQSNYICTFKDKKAVLRIYENRDLPSISYEVDILKKIYNNGFFCPMPYAQKNGEFIGSILSKNYVVYKFLEGEHLENPSSKQYEELVQAVAKFNLSSKGVRSNFEKYRINYSPDFCISHATKIAKEINTENAYKKLEWYLSELNKLQFPENLSKSVCHGDFHFSNILYKDGKFNALIDFDDANYTYTIFDLVCLMDPFGKNGFEWHNWMNFSKDSDVFDFEKSRNVLKTYCEINPISSLELSHIYDVLSLTVLIDCLWYFERGDSEDFFEKRKIEYLQKLGRKRFLENITSI